MSTISTPAGFTGPVELAPSFRPRPGLRHAVMDWDGTISLLRGGWVDVMVDIAIDDLASLSREMVHAEMLALNGRPSIHQMARIVELVTTGGGQARTSDDYQALYVQRITDVIARRVQDLRAGGAPTTLLVPGVGALLGGLAEANVGLTVVSGTPHPELLEEAVLLNVGHYFDDRFHGPLDTADRDFTKRAAIHSIVDLHNLDGESLVAIGDGPIEMRETKALGGLAIGVASDESKPGSRRFDDFKRRQLFECGADIVVPDYQDAVALLHLILGR